MITPRSTFSHPRSLLRAALAGTALALISSQAMAEVTVVNTALYSSNAAGRQGNDFSKNPVFSPDGKKIAFESRADRLVGQDTNLRYDIFVKTLANGAIKRVSTNAAGVQANDDSGQPVFSPDGNFVAFRSFASNLVGGGAGQWHIYVKNLSTGAIIRASTSGSGVPANGFSYNPVFSHDGKKIAFESDATNLTAVDDGLFRDVFVKNLVNGAVTRVSSSASAKRGNGDSANPVFSPDDTKVAFDSYANNLVPKDRNGFRDVFVKTLSSGAIVRVSTNKDGKQGPGSSGNPAFSPDGKKIAFWSNWPVVLRGDANNTSDVFVKTLASGAVVRVSSNASGHGGNTASFNPAFSPNGNSIAFISLASNLVKGDANNFEDIFVKDLASEAIARVTVNPNGRSPNGRSWTEDGSGKSYSPVFNAASDKIVFPSAASNLVSGDRNGVVDVFVVTISGN